MFIIVSAAQSETGHVARGEHRDSEENGDAAQRPHFQNAGEAFPCLGESMSNHLTIQLNSH